MSLTNRARRAARKRHRYVRIHGGGTTTPTRAIELIASGRAYLNENGDLELVLKVREAADPLDGHNFAWYPQLSGGVVVRKARIAQHASFR